MGLTDDFSARLGSQINYKNDGLGGVFAGSNTTSVPSDIHKAIFGVNISAQPVVGVHNDGGMA